MRVLDAGGVTDAVPLAHEARSDLPLAGIRVVELGRFAAAPACATLLADWGADVVKIEPLGGDPARGPGSVAGGPDAPPNPRFEVHNRTRRGLALDLSHLEGRSALDRILEQADVFVTNVSPVGLEHLQLDLQRLRERHPRLILAQISGYNLNTPAGRQRSYDHGAFWAYSGAASLFASADGEPPQPTGGFGDRAAGSILAGAIATALFRRERTGHGGLVTTSLVDTGLWLMASDVSDILVSGSTKRSADRRTAGIPTLNCFRTADGRWLWLQLMVPEAHWTALLRALDAEWLDDDPRFRGGDSANLRAASAPLIELLDEIFRERLLSEWDKRLTEHGITWAPVRSLDEAVADPVVRSSSAFVEIDYASGTQLSVNSPCRFVGTAHATVTRAPRVGEHGRAVLADYGFSGDEIAALHASGALG
jgi:crotonobetainyl-CoA:carnitine CoA-transferase CaiB-like acyl-CoA transferase